MSYSEFEKRLVGVLKQNAGRYLDERMLLDDCGLSTVADVSTEAGCDICRAVEVLRLQGYEIDGDEGRGWRLTGLPEAITHLELESGLTTSFLGNCIFSYRVLGSTNQTARLLAGNGAPDGALLVAEEQSQGRGRRASAWFSPPGGGIWASLILRPGITPSQLGSLGLLAALSICLTLEDDCGLKPRIKWPNDIFIGGRKCAGILCESGLKGSQLNYVVLGFGLNVNIPKFPPPLETTAISLSQAAGGKRFDRVLLLQSLLDHLEDGYFKFLAEGFDSFLPRLQVRDYLRNRRVKIESAGRPDVTGQARGLDPEGRLIVERESDGAVLKFEQGHVIIC